MAIHFTIDPVKCDAFGYCAELFPEAITLDEWGYPIVHEQSISSAFLPTAKRVVRDCPRNAITFRVHHDDAPRLIARASPSRSVRVTPVRRTPGPR